MVAYRQPVLRAEIEGIRGVACGEILRQLMDRDLVRVAGRSEELGRPYLYGTTRRFLADVWLRDIEDLPRAEMFRSADDSLASAMADPMFRVNSRTAKMLPKPVVNNGKGIHK